MAKKELNYTVNVKTNDAVKSTDKLKKGLKGVEDQSKKTAKSTSELTGKLNGATGGAVSKFASLKGTLSTVITKFQIIKGCYYRHRYWSFSYRISSFITSV